MITSLKSKYESLAETLRGEIISGRWKPGDAIPSQQQLIDRYQVSLSTVRKSLSRLADQGYVGAKHGKGVFVLDPKHRPAAVPRKAIGFLMVQGKAQIDVLDMAVLNGATETAQSVGRRISYGFVLPIRDGIEDMEQFLTSVDGLVVIMRLSSGPNPMVLDSLRRSRIPVVLLEQPDILGVSADDFSAVYYDPETIGYSAAQILALNGHQRTALLHFSTPRAMSPMMDGFRRACKDHDIDPPEVIESHGHDQNVRVTQELADRADLTALAVVGWGHCNTLVGRLTDQGLRIPQDKSVLAIGNPNIGDLYDDFDVTGIVCLGERLGREAARILIESPSKCVEKTLIGQFHKGSTLAALSH